MSPAPNGPEDRRFAGEAWKGDPRFDAFKNGYLAYSKFLQDSVEQAPVDEKMKDQMRFAMRQYIDAMSPANFLASNPEAIQRALETGGKSLVEGTELFFKDLQRGRVSSTDEKAFEVGKNVAVTPGSVIYENDLIQLIQYKPTTAEVYERPLVIIPPCINKFYILDLTPENSFVRYAVAQGHTVFLASWRNITPEYGHLTWDDYLKQGPLTAIDVAQQITGADQVNTLGFCVGGTLLSSALAVMRANDEARVSSMTLLTTMLDFEDPGEIGTMITADAVAAKEALIGGGGILEGKDLALAFSSLRANDLIWPYVVNSYLKGKAPPAFDLLYWNSDGTNLPGPMFCTYVRSMYLENKLKDPGKTIQCGVPVDLSDIDIPAYLYASREDHIVPWHSAYSSNGLLGGPTTFVLGASGHIAGVINPPSKNKRNYWKNGRQGSDPEQWLQTSENVPGSWWPHWNDWLVQYAGSKVPAPAKPGSKQYKTIEPAPGRYVMAKAN
jgi:polyhydroxyalkanoate synthase